MYEKATNCILKFRSSIRNLNTNSKGFAIYEVIVVVMLLTISISLVLLETTKFYNNYRIEKFIDKFYKDLLFCQNMSIISENLYFVEILSESYRIRHVDNDHTATFESTNFVSRSTLRSNTHSNRILFNRDGSPTYGGCTIFIKLGEHEYGIVTITPITGRIKKVW